MIIRSTNLASPVRIRWNGREEMTGIYKKPEAAGIYLGRDGVRGDTIGNPRVHGDRYKACYLFSVDDYPYWKERYPHLEWGFGMFGENLSVEGLSEQNLRMGATFRLGEARIRITTPREPCYKLGIRFGDQGVIDRFVAHGRPGAYAEVLTEGTVRPGDRMELESDAGDAPDIAAYYRLLFAPKKDLRVLRQALEVPFLTERSKKQLQRWLRSMDPS